MQLCDISKCDIVRTSLYDCGPYLCNLHIYYTGGLSILKHGFITHSDATSYDIIIDLVY